ncbi:MAG: hypothetical protein KDD37_02985 [Bdellovibrionales bacterium]|nr:hypothetical protein [Bdellovibrionales bacterium]
MKHLTANQVITDAIQFLKNHSEKIAVIDLDSTLYNASGRQIQIFREFASDPKFQAIFPLETAILKDITGADLAYYPVDCLKQMGHTNIHKDFSSVYHEYWSPKFFSNEYLIYDKIEDGALDFMEKLEHHGFKIIFLTGRDVARMGRGTKEQLVRDNALIKGRELILKPHLSEDDHSFKLRIVHGFCKNEGTGLVFIDNEAHNLNHIHQEKLPVWCVFFDTVH